MTALPRRGAGASASPTVPAVALQKFLFHLQQKQWEKAKAMAFQSAHLPCTHTLVAARYIYSTTPRSGLRVPADPASG